MSDSDAKTKGNAAQELLGPRLAGVEAMALLDHPAGLHPPSHGADGSNAGEGLPDRTPHALAEVV